jgi:hypothetical protein
VISAARDWVDYATFAAAAAAALATFCAALVALFGPRWQAKRSLPRVTLTTPDEIEVPLVANAKEARSGLYVDVTNQAGRDTARDVEVYIRDVPRFAPDVPEFASRNEDAPLRNINLGVPLDGSVGLARVGIPAGVTRRVALFSVGHPAAILEETGPADMAGFGDEYVASHGLDQFAVAALNLCPARRNQMFWIGEGFPFGIELVVAGRNFDAARYYGAFTVERAYTDDPEEGHPGYVIYSAHWVQPLSRESRTGSVG